MKRGWHSTRGRRTILLLVLLVAPVLIVNRGLALPGERVECANAPSWANPQGEPPLGAPPKAVVEPAKPPIQIQSPAQPFTPPPPMPHPPGQDGLFTPAVPFVGAAPMDTPVPIVRLRVRAPAQMEAEKEIEYHLTVENASSADAHHVVVRDRLPKGVEDYVRAEPKPKQQTKNKDGLTDLLWELGTLKAGDHKEIALTIKPKGTDDVVNRAYVQFEHGQKVSTRIAKPGLRVRMDAPAQTVSPNPVVFRVEVSNAGPLAARDVVVKDVLPEELVYGESKPPTGGDKPLLWKLGTLRPGEMRRVELQAVPIKAGTFENKVEVSAAGGVKETKSVRVTVAETKLKVRVSGPQRRLVARDIPFHVSVHNTGTVPLTNVQVNDEVPAGINFVSATEGGRREGGFVRWTLPSLRAGERRSLRVVFRAADTGWFWNEVSAQAGPHLSDKERSESTRIEAANGPAIEIDKETASLMVGEKTRYVIRILNRGKTACRDLRLCVIVPDGMSIHGKRGQTPGQQDGQKVRFDTLANLESGREAEYVVEVTAQKAGEALLVAQLLGEGPSSGPPQTWEDRSMIYEAAPAAHLPDRGDDGRLATLRRSVNSDDSSAKRR